MQADPEKMMCPQHARCLLLPPHLRHNGPKLTVSANNQASCAEGGKNSLHSPFAKNWHCRKTQTHSKAA
jgi:hypothetical protein